MRTFSYLCRNAFRGPRSEFFNTIDSLQTIGRVAEQLRGTVTGTFLRLRCTSLPTLLFLRIRAGKRQGLDESTIGLDCCACSCRWCAKLNECGSLPRKGRRSRSAWSIGVILSRHQAASARIPSSIYRLGAAGELSCCLSAERQEIPRGRQGLSGNDARRSCQRTVSDQRS